MSKIKLTTGNNTILAGVKRYKKGVSLSQLADDFFLSFGGIVHHITRLKSAGKVKQDKKTRKWFIK